MRSFQAKALSDQHVGDVVASRQHREHLFFSLAGQEGDGFEAPASSCANLPAGLEAVGEHNMETSTEQGKENPKHPTPPPPRRRR
jgi:hypothetical protein